MMQKVIILIFIICNFSIAIAQKSTDNFSGKWKTEKAKLGFYILLSMIPAGLTGYFLNDLMK
jgi:undecaprenyl pyrophosphate phosphatase UppP